MHDRIPRHPSPRLAIVAVVTALGAAAACAAPKHDAADAARRDSVVADSIARQTRARADSLRAAAPGGSYMPNAKTDSGGVMSNAVPRKPRPEPMPTVTTPTPAVPPPPPPNKKPPTRVVPDPVHARPTDTTAAARDSLHDLPADYGVRRPERRRVLPPIKP